MSASWWGTGPGIPQEQPMAFEVTADGVLTITRQWKGGIGGLATRQSKVRDAMPPLNFFNAYNPYPFVQCKCVSSRITHDKSEIYILEEIYQGTYILPFSIYQWQTQRLDRSITMHPKFDDGTHMVQGLHWACNPQNPGMWEGFPPYTISSIQYDDKGNYLATAYHDGITPTGAGTNPGPFHNATKTPNPYRGIEAYPVSTGTWHRTMFTTAPIISGVLWLLDPPQWDSTVPETLVSSLPDPTNVKYSWIRAQNDAANLYRGASQLWQIDDSWLYNSLGWDKDIFSP
jgi:hypothetical protein